MLENQYVYVLAVFSVNFGWNQVKICKNMSTVFIFYIFCRYSLFFFLQGKVNCWGGPDRKISAPVSALYMTFGSQGWRALFDLVDTFGPKV